MTREKENTRECIWEMPLSTIQVSYHHISESRLYGNQLPLPKEQRKPSSALFMGTEPQKRSRYLNRRTRPPLRLALRSALQRGLTLLGDALDLLRG